MKYVRMMLIAVLAIVGLGYCNFIANASGDLEKGIYYNNIEYTDNVEFKSVDGVKIDYSAQLNTPGDYYELYFDIVNSTNYDVAISDCIYNEDDDYIGYDLTYENGEKIGMGDVIKKHDTIRVKYKVLYKNYINVESYVIDTSFSILYEQVI